MMATNVTAVPVRALALSWDALARQQTSTDGHDGSSPLKVFLDCDTRFEAWMRSEVDFVAFVGSREDADLCVRATPVAGQGTSRHYDARFIGAGRFERIEASAHLQLPRPETGGTDVFMDPSCDVGYNFPSIDQRCGFGG